MSVKLMGRVWELDLPSEQQTVLLALADNAHDDGTRCYPCVDYLAWKTGRHKRTVQRVLRELEEAAVIVAVRHAGGGRGHATEYRIVLSKAKQKAPYTPKRSRAGSLKDGNLPLFRERVAFDAVKGDTGVAERVAFDAVKGDTGATPTVINHQGTVREPARARANSTSYDEQDLRELAVGRPAS